jgi:hypothetical protein
MSLDLSLSQKFLKVDGSISYEPMGLLLDGRFADLGHLTAPGQHSVPTRANTDAMHVATMRLDYALASASLQQLCVGSSASLVRTAETSELSDHFPLLVHLDGCALIPEPDADSARAATEESIRALQRVMGEIDSEQAVLQAEAMLQAAAAQAASQPQWTLPEPTSAQPVVAKAEPPETRSDVGTGAALLEGAAGGQPPGEASERETDADVDTEGEESEPEADAFSALQEAGLDQNDGMGDDEDDSAEVFGDTDDALVDEGDAEGDAFAMPDDGAPAM